MFLIERLLTNVAQTLSAVISEPTMKAHAQPFVVLENPPKIADA